MVSLFPLYSNTAYTNIFPLGRWGFAVALSVLSIIACLIHLLPQIRSRMLFPLDLFLLPRPLLFPQTSLAKANRSPVMASRPQNIGIKAIEIYFPSQVCVYAAPWHRRVPLHYYPFSPTSLTVLNRTVCRAIRAREVRWRRYGQIHDRPRPDQDELLR